MAPHFDEIRERLDWHVALQPFSLAKMFSIPEIGIITQKCPRYTFPISLPSDILDFFYNPKFNIDIGADGGT